MDIETGKTIDRPEADLTRFQCNLCQQTFGRVEHLTRHSRSHSKERYLKCSFCHKGFYRGSDFLIQLRSFSTCPNIFLEMNRLTYPRSDALTRHEQVHKEPKRSTLGRGVRACLACAKARRKCSGDSPCSACEKRSIECSYPPSNDARSRAGGKNVDRTPMVFSGEQSTELPHGQSSEANRAIASSERTSESWSNVSRSPAARGRDELSLLASSPKYNPNGSAMSVATINVAPFATIGQHVPSSTVHPQIPLDSHNNLLGPSPERPAVTPLQPSYLRNSIMDFQQVLRPEAGQTWSSSGSAQAEPMSVDTNTTLSRVSEPNFWSQNGHLSAINWLPENWIPDFDFDSGEPPSQNHYPAPLQTSQDRSRSVPDIGSTGSQLDGNTPTISSEHGITSPESDTQGVGYYYVDGDGARLPRVRKALHRSSHQSSDPYTPLTGVDGFDHINNSFGFSKPEYGSQSGSAMSSMVKQIPIEIYSEILHVFNQTCVTSSYFSPFHSGDFPSLESLGLFVRLYIEHFQPILPFIHPATFNLSSSHWLLTLAMAAMGSHYVDEEDVDAVAAAMHEFLRRAISMVVSLSEPLANFGAGSDKFLVRDGG